jgi:hypothetical protein
MNASITANRLIRIKHLHDKQDRLLLYFQPNQPNLAESSQDGPLFSTDKEFKEIVLIRLEFADPADTKSFRNAPEVYVHKLDLPPAEGGSKTVSYSLAIVATFELYPDYFKTKSFHCLLDLSSDKIRHCKLIQLNAGDFYMQGLKITVPLDRGSGIYNISYFGTSYQSRPQMAIFNLNMTYKASYAAGDDPFDDISVGSMHSLSPVNYKLKPAGIYLDGLSSLVMHYDSSFDVFQIAYGYQIDQKERKIISSQPIYLNHSRPRLTQEMNHICGFSNSLSVFECIAVNSPTVFRSNFENTMQSYIYQKATLYSHKMIDLGHEITGWFALEAKQSPVDILLRKQYQLTDSSQSKNLSFDAVRYYTGYPVMLPSPYKFLNGPIAFNYTGEIEQSSAYVKIEVSGIEGKIIHFDYDTRYLLAYRESEFILYRCLLKM